MSEYNIQMNKYNALNDEYDQLYPQPMKHANTHAKDGSDPITPANIGAVPTTRTVNGKALSANITLAASDVNAYSKSETDTLLQNKIEGLGKIITEFSQIGLTEATATDMLTVVNAMPSPSIAYLKCSTAASDNGLVPYNYGVLTIFKNDNNYCMCEYSISGAVWRNFGYVNFAAGTGYEWSGWKTYASTDYAFPRDGSGTITNGKLQLGDQSHTSGMIWRWSLSIMDILLGPLSIRFNIDEANASGRMCDGIYMRNGASGATYKFLTTENVLKSTSDITAGSTSLGDDAQYLVYE